MAELALSKNVTSAAGPRAPYGAWGLRAAALTYLLVLVLIPFVVIGIAGFRNGIPAFWEDITRPVAVDAIWLTVWTAAVMTVINIVMGTITAYVLANYKFPGKKVLDTLIDLPFAIPTLVTGVMLVLLYGPQTTVGKFFDEEFGFRIMYAPPAIVLALLFIGYPFVVRAVQPVLAQMDPSQQEAARTLGASSLTIFRRIILPAIQPAILTGGLLSFARALGEFGSIAIVSGNIPRQTTTAAYYVYGQVESGNPESAAGVSVVLLLISLTVTLIVDQIHRRAPHA
jgi:sulfate/thiosulfate transport system permease protein